MDGNPPPRTERDRRALAIIVVATVTGVGCSVEKNYELLSFFFDGVPAPQSADDAAADGDRPGGAAAIASAHQAYLDRRCTECHGQSSRFGFFAAGFSGLDGGVCVQCHADVVAAPPRLHGPVAAMACLWCHEPHQSSHPSLLVEGSPGVCLRCHQMQLQGATATPGHEPPEDCLACHDAHGGGERYFLRAQPDEAAPTAPPDEATPGGGTQPGPAEP